MYAIRKEPRRHLEQTVSEAEPELDPTVARRDIRHGTVGRGAYFTSHIRPAINATMSNVPWLVTVCDTGVMVVPVGVR